MLPAATRPRANGCMGAFDGRNVTAVRQLPPLRALRSGRFPEVYVKMGRLGQNSTRDESACAPRLAIIIALQYKTRSP